MWRWRQHRVLNEAALQLMQIQLDTLVSQIKLGDRDGCLERIRFWSECGERAQSKAAALYWEHLVEHGMRLMKQAYP